MRRGVEIDQRIGLIRQAARRLPSAPPFSRMAMVEACEWLEHAGLPGNYHLPESARSYFPHPDVSQLVVVLAEQVGNPRVSPIPPLWPLVALLLLSCRNTLEPVPMMESAGKPGVDNEVRRGLAIVAYLFPELEEWLAGVPLGIPAWERTLAVPLAARKLVLVERMD